MPQNPPNYDPATGQWHADPMWRRYDPNTPPQKPNITFGNAVDRLKGLKRLFQPSPAETELEQYDPELGPDFDEERPTVPPSPFDSSDSSAYLGQPQVPDVSQATAVNDPAITGLRDVMLPGPSSRLQSSYSSVTPPTTPQEASDTLGPDTFGAGIAGQSANRMDLFQEMARNRELAAGSSGMMRAGATGADIAGLAGAMESDPYTGREERERLADIQRKSTEATLGGFGTPQAQSQAAQEAETYKVDAPVRAQEMAGQYDVAQQQEASRGALDVAETRAEQFQDLQNMFNVSGRNIGRASIPGVGSIGMEPNRPIPTALSRDLTALRQTLEDSKNWLGGYDSAAVNTYKQGVQNVLARATTQAAPNVRQTVFEDLSDPNRAMKPLDELIEIDLADPETQQYIALMQEIRGF